MPKLVYRQINFDNLKDSEKEYNQIQDDEIVDFQKIRNDINVLHRMLIINYEKGHNYIRKSKKYNWSEQCIILKALREDVANFNLHNCDNKAIKQLEKDFVNFKHHLTYD